jgi:hypothetical protein
MQIILPLALALVLGSPPPAPGARVADFALKDSNGQSQSLAGYTDKKAVVIVFVGTECMLVIGDIRKTFS